MAKILVTGAAGFIGSNLVERLLDLKNVVIGVDNFDPFYSRDIKQQNLQGLLRHPGFSFYEFDLGEAGNIETITEPIDIVVHLAGKAGVRPSIDDPNGYIKANITATNNILEWMQKRNIKKLVFASSSSVYGNNKKVPFEETDLVDNPISPYAFTKKACELLNHVYHSLYKMDIINLRFFTVYGPRQRPDLAIHKFVKMIDNNIPLTVYGDGSTARDYTFVEDTVSGIISSIEFVSRNINVFEVVNLGNSTPVKLLDLINHIYTIMDKEPQIEYLPMQPGDVDITYASIDKATKLINYNPQTPIEAGLKKFVEWYRSHKK
ncbi:NAD-dependent epimerase/dehydratase family protein [Rufibacter ruber]|uniref:NAD-dependent epimerase/dehydratase family protein n=1 Tax=Rufibacter ruber TaxID=1783499 RepID=UPI00082D1A47|nr:NAD-dependent epimerase/dehydratase family protein [Rufibacter ruber]